MHELFNIVSLQAIEKSIEIAIDIDDKVQGTVLMFDEQRISSIVQNLAMNAIKFSNKGGEIRIVAQFADEES